LAKGTFFALAILVLLGGMSNAQTVDNDAKAAARELMATMGVTKQFDAMLPTLFDVMKPAIVQGRPDVERDYEALRGPLMKGFAGIYDELLDAVAIIYAHHFTANEIRELTAFMRGPTGQKFVSETPVLMQEAMRAGQQIGAKMGEEVQQKMIEELRKRGHKI
jgi:hypothetical protein